MTRFWLSLAGFIIAILLTASSAEAQKTCSRVTATSQTCTATLDWVASVVDATHDAPTSYQIRRADGTGAKVQIGTVNVPVVSFQNGFTDAGNVAHCWDVLAVNANPTPSPPSPQACWTTPVIVPLEASPPTSLIVR